VGAGAASVIGPLAGGILGTLVGGPAGTALGASAGTGAGIGGAAGVAAGQGLAQQYGRSQQAPPAAGLVGGKGAGQIGGPQPSGPVPITGQQYGDVVSKIMSKLKPPDPGQPATNTPDQPWWTDLPTRYPGLFDPATWNMNP
jgi:hypothetical protein